MKNIKNTLKFLSLFLVLGMGSRVVLGMYDHCGDKKAIHILPEVKEKLVFSLARLVAVTASSRVDSPNKVADFFANASRICDQLDKTGSNPHEHSSIAHIANMLTACCDLLDEYVKTVDPKTKKATPTRTKAQKATLTLLALTEGLASVIAAYGDECIYNIKTTQNRVMLDVAAFASILHSYVATNNKYKKAMCLLVMVYMLSDEIQDLSIAALG